MPLDIRKVGTGVKTVAYYGESVLRSGDSNVKQAPFLGFDAVERISEDSSEHPVRMNERVATIHHVEQDYRICLQTFEGVYGRRIDSCAVDFREI